MLNRVRKLMLNGFTLGGRTWRLLLFGESQLREHGAWFFADSPTLTAERIRSAFAPDPVMTRLARRRSLGNFDSIKIVAKHAARLG